jgi:hypothetical protein
MSAFIKYLIPILLITQFGCGNKNQEEKVIADQNFGEHKSTHESEWEDHSEKNIKEDNTSNYKLEFREAAVITEKSAGTFLNPKFTRNGKYLLFTNDNYGQIWLYDIIKKNLKKIIEMPQCGFRYQIAENNNEIYFRNKGVIGDRKDQVYSIYRYSISKDKIETIYNSDDRISQLLLNGNSIYFLENKKPTNLNLLNKSLSAKFDFPYFFVQNDLLVRASETVDTIKYSNKDYRFISCEYSKDREVVFVLTATNGILILDLSGKILKQYEKATYISKLYKSNLILFTEGKDDGMKIISSNLKFGFLNSFNKISAPRDFNNKIFNPDWSPVNNKLAYSSDNGMINILSFNLEKSTQ